MHLPLYKDMTVKIKKNKKKVEQNKDQGMNCFKNPD